ncbi:phage major capsid protein [Megasphaera sueciensis]|uniref:phage major capsid protein n=1 Tax=Megasphaera sueciensis TaxID=349094 RepID=UPI003D0727D4
MKKSDEIKQQITAQRTKVEALQGKEQWDDAAAEAKVLNDLIRDYKTQATLEESQFENFVSGPTKAINKVDKVSEKKIRNRAFNHLILDNVFKFAQPSDQEKAFIDTFSKQKVLDAVGTPGQAGGTDTKGGYLVPTEQFQQILEFRRAYQALKPYCNIVSVTSRKGTMPTIGHEDGTLTAFEELNAIKQDDLDFGQIQFSTADYGDIIPIARELLQDIDVDLMGLVGRRFTQKSVNTENAQIVGIINGLTKHSISDYTGIATALNKELDPAISANAVIFTNQTGYDYLDNLVDANKRPLLTQSLADPTQYLFKGRKVVVLKDTLLTSDTSTAGTTKVPFLIGSMADLVYFWDRVGVEVAVSDQAGFTSNAIFVRAIERFGVTAVDTGALYFGQYSITSK